MCHSSLCLYPSLPAHCPRCRAPRPWQCGLAQPLGGLHHEQGERQVHEGGAKQRAGGAWLCVALAQHSGWWPESLVAGCFSSSSSSSSSETWVWLAGSPHLLLCGVAGVQTMSLRLPGVSLLAFRRCCCCCCQRACVAAASPWREVRQPCRCWLQSRSCCCWGLSCDADRRLVSRHCSMRLLCSHEVHCVNQRCTIVCVCVCVAYLALYSVIKRAWSILINAMHLFWRALDR